MHVNLRLLVGNETPVSPHEDIILEKKWGIKKQGCGLHRACHDPLANHSFSDLFKLTVLRMYCFPSTLFPLHSETPRLPSINFIKWVPLSFNLELGLSVEGGGRISTGGAVGEVLIILAHLPVTSRSLAAPYTWIYWTHASTSSSFLCPSDLEEVTAPRNVEPWHAHLKPSVFLKHAPPYK